MGQYSLPWKKIIRRTENGQKWAFFLIRWQWAVYANQTIVCLSSISNSRHSTPQSASNHLAICVTLPRNPRQTTRSPLLFRTLSSHLWPPYRPQMTPSEIICAILNHSDKRPTPSQMSFPFAKTRKKADQNLSRIFSRNFSSLKMSVRRRWHLNGWTKCPMRLKLIKNPPSIQISARKKHDFFQNWLPLQQVSPLRRSYTSFGSSLSAGRRYDFRGNNNKRLLLFGITSESTTFKQVAKPKNKL